MNLCGDAMFESKVSEHILSQPLAFSTSSSSLVAASSRLVCKTKDGAFLNIEIFSNDDIIDKSSSPILIFIHGVCASAESLGVQNVVSSAKENNVRVAVIELEGHGLSSGQRCVCQDFDRLAGHVVEAVRHITSSIGSDSVPYFLSGNSLGGVLSIYAAQMISDDDVDVPTKKEKKSEFGTFMGLMIVAPAVGVQPDVVPSYPIVQALKMMALIAPSATVPLTPMEDPTLYNCPKDTKRNYSGHWPLATSKMLLDVTSNRVRNDIQSGWLSLKNLTYMLIIIGEADDVVPSEAVKTFYDSVNPFQKEIISIDMADHSILFDSKHSKIATNAIFTHIKKTLSSCKDE